VIERVSFHRFKQFRDETVALRPGVSLLAGGNNSGKTTILHGLAVWEFCRTAVEMERGPETFLEGRSRQGLGLGDDEFSPINVPTLKHLWTNLKSQKDHESDGYTLKIRCEWRKEGRLQHLEFGLALSNDRLFVKVTSSNLADDDRIPRVAFLPPFAGMTDREARVTGAIRRRRIGEGLAGAVLRNILLDMQRHNLDRRRQLRGDRPKIADAALRDLRADDPWELLQQDLRETFGAELFISPFREEYHSYIQVEVLKGAAEGFKLRRHHGYNNRDLMVEGSGFLQWLSVFALARDEGIDVLLLDEPDAHLHNALQEHLVERLEQIATQSGKQVLVATHSAEILRNATPGNILRVGGPGNTRYLAVNEQKVGLLVGLGSTYAPRIDRLKRTRRLLLVEGRSDVPVLKAIAAVLGLTWPEDWVEWRTTSGHRERRQLVAALRSEIPDLVALSLRDRDDEPMGSVSRDLVVATDRRDPGFHPRRWRRRYLESYLVCPRAISEASGLPEAVVRDQLAEVHGVAVPSSFTVSDAPAALMDVRAKELFKNGGEPIMGQFDVRAHDVARVLKRDEVCADLVTFLTDVVTLAQPHDQSGGAGEPT
jgi:predicted ATPase